MQNISSLASLEEAIAVLEVKKKVQELELRNHFQDMKESVRPVNILKSSAKKMFTGRGIVGVVTGTAVALGAGMIVKKVLIAKSSSIFRRVIGGIITTAATKIISKKAAAMFDNATISSDAKLKGQMKPISSKHIL